MVFKKVVKRWFKLFIISLSFLTQRDYKMDLGMSICGQIPVCSQTLIIAAQLKLFSPWQVLLCLKALRKNPGFSLQETTYSCHHTTVHEAKTSWRNSYHVIAELDWSKIPPPFPIQQDSSLLFLCPPGAMVWWWAQSLPRKVVDKLITLDLCIEFSCKVFSCWCRNIASRVS